MCGPSPLSATIVKVRKPRSRPLRTLAACWSPSPRRWPSLIPARILDPSPYAASRRRHVGLGTVPEGRPPRARGVAH